MKIVVGNSVEEENFFGRDRELEILGQLVETGSVLLLAPRRVGKSSLLRALPKVPRSDGLIPVYADVQDCKTEGRFVESVLRAIYATPQGRMARPNWWKRWRARGRSRVKSLQAPGGLGVELEAVDHGWLADADEAFDRLLRLDRRWLVLIDEVPNVVVALANADPSGERVRGFLSWFRRLRLRPDAADKLRFVLCGSIGLDSVARRYGITDTINDLRAWNLGPFDEATAVEFVSLIAEEYDWSLASEVRAQILREVEWYIPYHLQALMGELQLQGHGGTVETQHIDAAVEGMLSKHSYFSSWDERLTPSLGTPGDAHARAILRVCALDPRGATRSTISGALASSIASPEKRASTVSELLDMLFHDGYLVEAEGRIRFRSAILRRYWLRHFA
jgi:hypothetical protein